MIKRTTELKRLQKHYEENGSRLVLLYGSNRSEKSQLIRDFCKGRSYFYYCARNASSRKQMELLKHQIESENNITIEGSGYTDCLGAFVRSQGSKSVIIIDEFARIARRQPEFWDAVIELCDPKKTGRDVLVILATEQLIWVRKDMDKSYLGRNVRFDDQIFLHDLSFLDVVRNLPDYSVADAVATYGIIGGVPAYVDSWDAKSSVRDNVIRMVLDERGFLYKEVESLFAADLREPEVYDTIMSSMALGLEKLNELHLATGYSRAKISVYLKNLAALDIIEKVVSFDTGGWENAKKGIYRISNHFMDFWFHFIYPHLSELTIIEPEEFYDTYIAPRLDEYLRRYFVDVCKEYLALLNMVGKVPIHIEKLGTWIGKQGTIDVVGRDSIRNSVVGVTNWDAPMLTYDRYEQLISDMKSARIKASVIYLFSAKDFDDRLKALEKEPDSHVVLVDMTEL